jgi:zinc protease
VPAGVSAATVIDSYFAAIGGKDKAAGVKDLEIIETGNVQGQKVVETRRFVVPGGMQMDIELPDIKLHAVHLIVNGDSITLTQSGQSPTLDEETKKEIREETAPFPELNFFRDGFKTELTSIEDINGKDAYKVKVTYPSGHTITYYYDTGTGLKVRVVRTQGPSTTTTDYGDYRDVNGVKIPYHVDDNQGEVDLDMTVQSVKVNAGLTTADLK